jgi:hypothetical protein
MSPDKEERAGELSGERGGMEEKQYHLSVFGY